MHSGQTVFPQSAISTQVFRTIPADSVRILRESGPVMNFWYNNRSLWTELNISAMFRLFRVRERRMARERRMKRVMQRGMSVAALLAEEEESNVWMTFSFT